MEPKISVIIPVHNREKTVACAIESALSQSYPAWEIIAVDNGSTDDTPKILESFRGKISIRTIKPSASPAVPCNVGIQWSTGNFIAFLDPDVVWFKNKLKVQTLAVQRFPDAGFVCGDYIYRRAHGDRRRTRHFLRLPDSGVIISRPFYAFRQLLIRNFVGAPSTVMLSRRVIDRIGGLNPGYPGAEEYEYWFRCAKYAKFLVLRDTLAYCRNHCEDPVTGCIAVLQGRKRILLEVFTEHRDYLKEHRLLDECFRQLSRNNRDQSAYFASIGDRRTAMKLGLQSLIFSCAPENIGFWLRTGVRLASRQIRSIRERKNIIIAGPRRGPTSGGNSNRDGEYLHSAGEGGGRK